MKKKMSVVSVAEPKEASRLAGRIVPGGDRGLADLASVVKDGLLGFCADGRGSWDAPGHGGRAHTAHPKKARVPDREANWHVTTTGLVLLGGRLVSVKRPPARGLKPPASSRAPSDVIGEVAEAKCGTPQVLWPAVDGKHTVDSGFSPGPPRRPRPWRPVDDDEQASFGVEAPGY